MPDTRSAIFGELVRFHHAQHVLRQLSAQPGATPISMPLLATLVRSGPMRSSRLAELSCLDPSTVSRQADQLVRAGLVERLADPDDGRATLLQPSDAGRERLAAHRQRLETLLTGTILKDWSEEDLSTFATLLRRLNDEALDHLPALARDVQASASHLGAP